MRGSPVQSGTVASASGKGTKLSWDMKRGGRYDDTLDSGIGNLHSHETGLITESLLPDTIIDRRTSGVDASMPVLGQTTGLGRGILDMNDTKCTAATVTDA